MPTSTGEIVLPQGRPPNWFDRNWKWAVPMGCLGLVALLAIFVGAVFSLVEYSFQHSDALCLCSIPSEGQSYGGRENRPTDQDWLARDRERQCLWPIRKCRYCDTYNWSLGKGHNIRSSKEKRRHMAIRNATSGDIWRTAADRPFAGASEASGRTIKGRAVARVSAGDKGCPDD
jgi:hypothetical protein